MQVEVGTPAARRRKLFVLADEIGLSREERIEFARVLLWRDITSWGNLGEQQVDRLLDALEGYIFVTHTFMLRAAPQQRRDIMPLPGPDRR
jgi:hypothetical protein